MGCDTNQQRLIQQLQEMEKGEYKNNLRIFTTMDEQKASFGPIKNVQALRAASDFFTMPSHVEGLPLVSMEGQATGSLLIAPYHLGFIETCFPEGFENLQKGGGVYSLGKNANSVCYKDHTNSVEAVQALSRAVALWNARSIEEKNQIARSIRNYAVSNFNWIHEEGDVVTGQVLRYNRLFREVANNDFDQKSTTTLKEIEPFQPPIQPIPVLNRSLIQKIQSVAHRAFHLLKQNFQFVLNRISDFKVSLVKVMRKFYPFR